MTLRTTVQVGQAAAARARAEANSIVGNCKREPLRVGLNTDSDLRGLSMLGDVGQRYPQHSLDVADDRVVDHGVQRPYELQIRADWEQWRKLINNFEGSATERSGRFILQCEDRGPDLPNRLVELVDRAGEALLNDLVVRG